MPSVVLPLCKITLSLLHNDQHDMHASTFVCLFVYLALSNHKIILYLYCDACSWSCSILPIESVCVQVALGEGQSPNEGQQGELFALFGGVRNPGAHQAMLVLGQEGLGPHSLPVGGPGPGHGSPLPQGRGPLHLRRGHKAWAVSFSYVESRNCLYLMCETVTQIHVGCFTCLNRWFTFWCEIEEVNLSTST